MHAAAMEWIEAHATDKKVAVLDVGGRDINGTARALFPKATEYLVVDLMEHSSVDLAVDVLTLKSKGAKAVGPFDVIVYAEVAEHSPDWAAHIAHMHTLMAADGCCIITAAGPQRHPHSGIDGSPIRSDEFYENLSEDLLREAIEVVSDDYLINSKGADVRAVFYKGSN